MNCGCVRVRVGPVAGKLPFLRFCHPLGGVITTWRQTGMGPVPKLRAIANSSFARACAQAREGHTMPRSLCAASALRLIRSVAAEALVEARDSEADVSG